MLINARNRRFPNIIDQPFFKKHRVSKKSLVVDPVLELQILALEARSKKREKSKNGPFAHHSILSIAYTMHASLFFFAFLVSLSSAATYTVGQGDFVSRLEGVLLPGDEVIFPGLAAAPVEYTVDEFFSVSWVGTEGNPIVIRAAEVGGAIIRQMANQNILNVVRGQYFELKGLTFTGGSLGIRLGTGSLPTDTVTNALFEDLTITGTQGALITANSPANPAALKIVSDLIFRK